MSDEKKYTEREMVKAKREAFARGWLRDCSLDDAFAFDRHVIAAIAARHFPLPKVTRPRVVCAPVNHADFEFCVIDGELKERPIFGKRRDWRAVADWVVTLPLAQVWADLLANPTEEVEE